MDHLPFQLSELLLHKDNQLIAFNKPAGLPVQADKTGDASLLQLAQNYVKHPLQLLHRLDRPVSGLTLFAQKTATAISPGPLRKRPHIANEPNCTTASSALPSTTTSGKYN